MKAPALSPDLRKIFEEVTKGSLSGKAGEKATEDFNVNGEYVDTPDKGVVGIPFLDAYVEKTGSSFSKKLRSRMRRGSST